MEVKLIKGRRFCDTEVELSEDFIPFLNVNNDFIIPQNIEVDKSYITTKNGWGALKNRTLEKGAVVKIIQSPYTPDPKLVSDRKHLVEVTDRKYSYYLTKEFLFNIYKVDAQATYLYFDGICTIYRPNLEVIQLIDTIELEKNLSYESFEKITLSLDEKYYNFIDEYRYIFRGKKNLGHVIIHYDVKVEPDTVLQYDNECDFSSSKKERLELILSEVKKEKIQNSNDSLDISEIFKKWNMLNETQTK